MTRLYYRLRRHDTGSLGLIRRHFLLQGDNDGVGRLRPVELLVRHPIQLFRREMHVVMQVLFWCG